MLVDIGWPGTMGQMRASLKRKDIPLEEIRYAIATHYHIDHAGLGQEFKQAGVPLLVLDVQVEAIQLMKQWTKPQDNYLDISPDGNVNITCAQSRDLLAGILLPGEIVHTPGHSDDSVSLLLDNGAAFTGDLAAPAYVAEAYQEKAAASWRLLEEKGATQIYPAHGPPRPFSSRQS